MIPSEYLDRLREEPVSVRLYNFTSLPDRHWIEFYLNGDTTPLIKSKDICPSFDYAQRAGNRFVRLVKKDSLIRAKIAGKISEICDESEKGSVPSENRETELKRLIDEVSRVEETVFKMASELF